MNKSDDSSEKSAVPSPEKEQQAAPEETRSLVLQVSNARPTDARSKDRRQGSRADWNEASSESKIKSRSATGILTLLLDPGVRLIPSPSKKQAGGRLSALSLMASAAHTAAGLVHGAAAVAPWKSVAGVTRWGARGMKKDQARGTERKTLAALRRATTKGGGRYFPGRRRREERNTPPTIKLVFTGKNVGDD